MPLEKELATYREKLPELAQHEGKYVLIHGDEVADTYVAYEDALREGYRRFGLEPFLVKQVQVVEQVYYQTRGRIPDEQAA